MLDAMSISVLTAVVVAANVLGAAMAVPQAAKLLRTRRIAGVSVTWAVISAVVNGWWGVYGIGAGDLGIVPVSVVSVIAYLAIAVAVVRLDHRRPARTSIVPALAIGTAVAAVPAAALWLGGWPAAGLTLGLLYGVQLSPAVVAVYRSVDVAGVSVATWAIAWSEALLWGVYGGARLDAGLLALAATGTLMSSLVLARLAMRRPRRGRLSVPLGAPGLATV